MKIFKVQQKNQEGKIIGENIAMLTDKMAAEAIEANGDNINLLPITHAQVSKERGSSKEIMLLPLKYLDQNALQQLNMEYIYSATMLQFLNGQQTMFTDLISEDFIIESMTNRSHLFKQIILLDPNDCIVTMKESVLEFINSCGTIKEGKFQIPGCPIELDAEGKSFKDLTEQFMLTILKQYDDEIDEALEKTKLAEQAQQEAEKEVEENKED